MVPFSIRRELDALQKRLSELESVGHYRPNDENAKFDFADRTGDFITKLSLLLDKAMNRVWEVYNDQGPTKKKANVYFPLWESADRISDALARLQLSQLPVRNAKLQDALVAVQPFAAASPWLAKLKTLAGLRHERQPEINESSQEIVAPDPSKGFQMGTFIVKDEKMVEDDEAWVRMLNQSGMFAEVRETVTKGRMRIEVFTQHLLEATDMHPVDFCADCLANSRSLIRAIFRHMPS